MPRQAPRDREILNAVKDVAGLLLQATDWRECIDRVLACLGQGTDVSRVYIFENHPDPNGEPVASQRFEWSAPGATVQLANPAHQNQTYAAMGMERWLSDLSQGRHFQAHVDEFDASTREILVAEEIRSLLQVPILVNGEWWGLIGFDECRRERQWSEGEISALMAAAGIIGLTIHHHEEAAVLAETVRRYRSLFECSPVAVWEEDWSEAKAIIDVLRALGITDLRDFFVAHPGMVRVIASHVRVLDANPAAVRIYRAPDKNALIRQSADYLEHLGNVFDAGPWGRRFAELAEGATTSSIEKWVRTYDGEPFLTQSTATIDPDGRGSWARVLVALEDITERRRTGKALRNSEARLKAFLDNSPNEMLMKDTRGRFIMVNRTFEKLHGVSREEIKGKTAYDIFPKAFADQFTEMEQRVLETGESIEREEDFPLADGLRSYLVTKFPIADEDGNPIGIGSIETDITARKRAEEELRLAKEQADLANRTKSDFLANMSHELRTPLNAIIGFSEMIRGGMLGPVGDKRYLEYADHIHESGEHLLELINDILDLSKIEAGKIDFHEEAVDVVHVVRSTLVVMKERAETAGLTIQCDVPADLPQLRADERKIKQILLNLLSNAVKFTPRGGTVTLEVTADSRHGFVIGVIDTGIGIAPENMSKVMTPFGQAESHLGREYQGTGLGLPVTKALAELHGGTFEIESRPGEGTTARVRIPPERCIAPEAPLPGTAQS